MNKKNIRVIDTLKPDPLNPLLKYHVQRSFLALQHLNPKIRLSEVNDFYQKLPNKKEAKCRIIFDSNELNKSEIIFDSLDSLPINYTVSFSKIKFPILENKLFNFKTSERSYWDESLKTINTSDVIGINQNNQISDTSRFNIFIFDQGQFFTPPLESGCLNGCFRQYCLDQKSIYMNSNNYTLVEKQFSPNELLSKKIYLGNSLRGLILAELIADLTIE